MKRIVLIVALATASPLCAQTTIGQGGNGVFSLQLQNDVGVRNDTWIGQAFTSPGGVLTNFTFTDTDKGFSTAGPALFRLTSLADGVVGATLFERSITLGNIDTSIDGIDFFTVAGQMYLAYVTPDQAGANQKVLGQVYGNYAVGRSGLGFSYSGAEPADSGAFFTNSDYDLAYTASFEQASAAVPEPATWAMMTLGFGAMGFAMRRKKVSTRVRFA